MNGPFRVLFERTAAFGRAARAARISSLSVAGALFAAGSTLLGGCYVQTEPVVPVIDRNGEVVEVSPPPPPPVVAVSPPPPPVVAVSPPPPPVAPVIVARRSEPWDAGVVWVEGCRRWDGRRYVWQPGHYERPPRPRAYYVPGHWEARGGARIWINPHWS